MMEALADNGNFNTWDLAQSFESTDPHYQLAVVVAQYAELLRHSPPRYAHFVRTQGRPGSPDRLSSVLWNDPEVVEFAGPKEPGVLVSRASLIRALGQ